MLSTALRGFSLLVLLGFLTSPAISFAKLIDDDIRIDLPANGQIRVENRFGGVLAEVWNNNYISVSARIAADGRLRRSPIVVDNRGKLLRITVNRAPTDAAVIVDIVIKIPQISHLEVLTTTGSITLKGLPAQTVLKTTSGNIESTFTAGTNPTINARAPRGLIKSSLTTQPDSEGHVLIVRGSSDQTIVLETDAGQILLRADESEQSSAVSKPELVATDSSRAAGTPESQGATDEVNEGDVIRVDAQLVTLNMSVIDRSTNRGVVGLKQSDFQLFENGQAQKIVQFDSSSAPFDLVLLIDLSGSTKDVIKLIRSAALRFVEAARPADRISVVTFAGQATIVSPLTADRNLLRERVASIDTARGDTKLYDALQFTMTNVMKAPAKSRRTAIVLMSDGLDGTVPGVSDQIGSALPYSELVKNIQEFDGVLYTLWLNTRYEALNPRDTQPEAFDEGHDRMRDMADAGGGIFYEVNKLDDLAGAYEQVVADLGTVYSLVYRPSNKTRDGKWRSIKISVNRANAIARGKRGYYAN